MSLAAALQRTPQEIEEIGFLDALALARQIREREHERRQFEAACVGATLK